MDLDALLLSRIQFAFVVSFHIIFPAFTIGLAAWLRRSRGCGWRPETRSTAASSTFG